MYITQSDIERAHGVVNVRKWSNLDNTTGIANAANIQAAIDWAESRINMRFRTGKYAVPIVANTDAATLVGWCVAFAAWKLYSARGLSETDPTGNKLTAEYTHAKTHIAAVLAGEEATDFSQGVSGVDPTGPVVVG